MKALGINHLSVAAIDLEASLEFYEDVLGMERIPTYNFGFTTQYLRCGDLQIHVFLLEDKIPFYQHFAIDVDDFHAVYETGKKLGALDNSAFKNAVNELPDGSVQMYLRDPAGNLVEVDWPDISTLDTTKIPELKKLSQFADQEGEALQASLYYDRPHLQPHRRQTSEI